MKIDSWLAELGVPRDAYRVVMLLPLVYVAWADGKIHSSERSLILSIARDRGLLENGGQEALERWLSEAPSKAQLRSNLALLNELGRSHERIADEFGADELHLLLAWCQDVADAAGGMLGLRKARHDGELAALRDIAAALDVRSAKNWRAALG